MTEPRSAAGDRECTTSEEEQFLRFERTLVSRLDVVYVAKG